MFTGIIEAVGTIVAVRPQHLGVELVCDSSLDLSTDALGDSIAVDGVCLTVTAKDGSIFTAEASHETIMRSTLGKLARGQRVNIERALRLSSRLGGHIVLGHVDTVARIRDKHPEGHSVRMRIELDNAARRYVIAKGSIAVDGISLTVNTVTPEAFEINLIPHSQHSTSLTLKRAGDRVNLEFDVIGKYVERLLEKDGTSNPTLEDLLKRQGFM